MSLPNLVIAGVTKAGTTSLFRYLAQHPDVFPSDVKEVRYFQPLRYGEPLAPVATYAAHFAGHSGERYLMESTPGYFYGGRPLAQGMADVLPDVRVVVSFRDPADRCWSWYNFMRSRARLDKAMSFDQYVDTCVTLHEKGADGTLDAQPFWGVGGGCYDEWIDAWFETYGSRFRVIFFEDLVRQPQETVAELSRWLGLDDQVTRRFRYDVENKTEQYRNKGLQRAALGLNRAAGRFFGRHLALKRRLRRVYYSINRQPAVTRPSDQALARLGEFYAPHNRRLAEKIIARQDGPLPSWLTAHRPQSAQSPTPGSTSL